MSKYQYVESGLNNVFISGINPMTDDEGDEVVTIHHINVLHAEIARGIIESDGGINGAELRFLRTEMGLTQAELGSLLSVDGQTVGRYERGDTPIHPTAETLLRRLAGERLVEAFDKSIEELASLVNSDDVHDEINIEATENGYRLVA
jgi:transcriptional regulator with XRE-family HTH domain